MSFLQVGPVWLESLTAPPMPELKADCTFYNPRCWWWWWSTFTSLVVNWKKPTLMWCSVYKKKDLPWRWFHPLTLKRMKLIVATVHKHCFRQAASHGSALPHSLLLIGFFLPIVICLCSSSLPPSWELLQGSESYEGQPVCCTSYSEITSFLNSTSLAVILIYVKTLITFWSSHNNYRQWLNKVGWNWISAAAQWGVLFKASGGRLVWSLRATWCPLAPCLCS